MKTIDDLIRSAAELADQGRSRGEIADELNVSRETAAWLVDRGDGEPPPEEPAGTLNDIHVDWSAIGRDSVRLASVGNALAHLLSGAGSDVDLVVGIEKAGVPLATVVARDLEADLATYTPRKHQWEEGDIADLGGTFSRNFARIRGRDCFIVDDTITSGTTMREAIRAVSAEGGTATACGVLVDKRGVGSIDDVPVYGLLQVLHVGDR